MSAPKRKREVQLNFRVSPEELALIEQKMAQLGTKNREAAAGGSVRRADAVDRHPGPAYLRPVLPGHDGGRDCPDRGC